MADRVYMAGDRIAGRFELTRPLGKGAFGVVWSGLDHEADGATVAVKFLFDKYRRDKKMLGRFVQEAKILEKLRHPGIASPIAWNADGEDVFLAMEFIDGETLDRRFEGNARDRAPVPKQGIAWICDQLCAAVGFAHEHDVVHRDMKPKNVMVNRPKERPFLKVLDFGIAKMLVGSEIDPTTAGRVLGSVLYISPEQVMSRPIDHRADIFSIGTIMFELITLRRAWARDEHGDPHPFHVPIPGGELNSHVAVLKRIAREGRPSALALRGDLSPSVDEVLHKAMAINPDERYASTAELATNLRAALLEDGSLEDTGIPTLVDDETIRDARIPNEPALVVTATFDELATESEGVPAAGTASPKRSTESREADVPDEIPLVPIRRRSSSSSSFVWVALAAVIAVIVVLLLSR